MTWYNKTEIQQACTNNAEWGCTGSQSAESEQTGQILPDYYDQPNPAQPIARPLHASVIFSHLIFFFNYFSYFIFISFFSLVIVFPFFSVR